MSSRAPSSGRSRVASLVALTTACMLASACGSGRGVDDALAQAQPHLPSFARFTRWVRQARSADLMPAGAGAVAEATFAPLRGESSVLAAFVSERRHGRVIVLAIPEQSALPATLPWVTIRNAELGALRVAYFDACPVRTRSGKTEAVACVVLEKASDTTPGDTLSVSVVFRSPPES